MQKIIFDRLESECFGNRTIEVYGGVYHFAKRHADKDGGIAVFEDMLDFCSVYTNTIRNAKFFTPEVKPSQIITNICNLLYIDTMLFEVAIGRSIASFDEV